MYIRLIFYHFCMHFGPYRKESIVSSVRVCFTFITLRTIKVKPNHNLSEIQTIDLINPISRTHSHKNKHSTTHSIEIEALSACQPHIEFREIIPEPALRRRCRNERIFFCSISFCTNCQHIQCSQIVWLNRNNKKCENKSPTHISMDGINTSPKSICRQNGITLIQIPIY